VINETMAKRYFAGRDPIGKHWTYGGPIDANAFEIIGVVRDIHYTDLRSPIRSSTYALVAQGNPANSEELGVPYLSSLEVRTAGPPAAMADMLRRAVREVEPRLPIIEISTMTQRVDNRSRQEQLVAYLTTVFSAIALLLASLGLYGSISYAVTRRTSEIGVRIALGAGRTAVQWLIMRDAITLVAIGLVVGAPLSLLAASALRTMLFGIRFTDLATHLTAVGVLVLVALLAAYLPARRASRVDPMSALRAE
jgi:ABC-type lipoprotein release transport system permease subunit